MSSRSPRHHRTAAHTRTRFQGTRSVSEILDHGETRATAVHAEDAAADEAVDVLVEDLTRQEIGAAGPRRERVPADVDEARRAPTRRHDQKSRSDRDGARATRNATITSPGSTAPAGPLVSTAAATAHSTATRATGDRRGGTSGGTRPSASVTAGGEEHVDPRFARRLEEAVHARERADREPARSPVRPPATTERSTPDTQHHPRGERRRKAHGRIGEAGTCAVAAAIQ